MTQHINERIRLMNLTAALVPSSYLVHSFHIFSILESRNLPVYRAKSSGRPTPVISIAVRWLFNSAFPPTTQSLQDTLTCLATMRFLN